MKRVYLVNNISWFLLLLLSSCLCACGVKPKDSESVLYEKMIKGDFSSVADEYISKQLKIIYERMEDRVEWIKYDINQDGCEDLILQERNKDTRGLQKILGIFTYLNQELVCIQWDENDTTEYFALACGNLIYYFQYIGTYDYYSYCLYSYDEGWNLQLLSGLEIYEITDFDNMPPNWIEQYPEMEKEGSYYRKFIVDGENENKQYKILTENEWMIEYNKLTGATDVSK